MGHIKNTKMEEVVSDIPLITNDAVTFGILAGLLLVIFKFGEHPMGAKLYKIIPALLLCYFLPSLFSTFGIISPKWVDVAAATEALIAAGYDLTGVTSFKDFKNFVLNEEVPSSLIDPFIGKSQLYFMASRYLLPASLILLTLSISLKEVFRLGPKALIMFIAGTIGVVIGGPLAILLFSFIAPDVVGGVAPNEVWRGMTTIAGSWIGGGANQAAMFEIFRGEDNLISGSMYSMMITVDIIVAEVWMFFLLLGVGKSAQIDRFFKADASNVESLKNYMQNFSKKIERIPSFTDFTVILGIAFGLTGLAHLLSSIIAPWIKENAPYLADTFSLGSGFFWLIVLATAFGIALSFTKARNYEGAGASKIGGVFIYILVATIGMKMNVMAVFENPAIFLVGLTWMAVHVIILVIVAKIIRAPYFFLAVGSKANIGGAASAPVVAAAFHPSLAPVGVLLAVLGYAFGTYGALICGYLMQAVAP
ncbi:MAG: putative membrane protein [Cryomorphaceae bacterium]